jgi:hypothetical protein
MTEASRINIALADGIGVRQGDRYAGATFDNDDVGVAMYRFLLWRHWDDGAPPLPWIMLNPSTATHEQLDPTITRCIGYSKRWGFGGIIIANAYAFRATDPNVMLAQREADRIGPGNDANLARILAWARKGRAAMVAWGDNLPVARESQMRRMITELEAATQCLGRTRRGSPRHPVRLGYDTPVVDWP